MRTQLFSQEGSLEQFYDESYEALVVKWYDWSDSDLLRKAVKTQQEATKKFEVTTLIVDSSECATKVPTVDQVWIENEVFPLWQQLGVYLIVTVESSLSSLPKVSARVYSNAGKRTGLEMVTVGSMGEALDIAYRRKNS